MSGELRMGRITLSLEQVGGVYARLMDDRRLPESVALAGRRARSGRSAVPLHDAIGRGLLSRLHVS